MGLQAKDSRQFMDDVTVAAYGLRFKKMERWFPCASSVCPDSCEATDVSELDEETCPWCNGTGGNWQFVITKKNNESCFLNVHWYSEILLYSILLFEVTGKKDILICFHS
jgi:hypothetical protein